MISTVRPLSSLASTGRGSLTLISSLETGALFLRSTLLSETLLSDSGDCCARATAHGSQDERNQLLHMASHLPLLAALARPFRHGEDDGLVGVHQVLFGDALHVFLGDAQGLLDLGVDQVGIVVVDGILSQLRWRGSRCSATGATLPSLFCIRIFSSSSSVMPSVLIFSISAWISFLDFRRDRFPDGRRR